MLLHLHCILVLLFAPWSVQQTELYNVLLDKCRFDYSNCLCSCLLSLIFSAYSPEWSSAHVSHRPVRAGNHSRHYQERELIHCCLTLMERFIQTSTVGLFTSLNYPCKHRCWVSVYFNHYEENSRAFGMLCYFDLLLVIQYVLRIGFGSFVFPLFSKMFKRSCTNLPVSVLNTSPVSLQNKWFRPQSVSQVLRLFVFYTTTQIIPVRPAG